MQSLLSAFKSQLSNSYYGIPIKVEDLLSLDALRTSRKCRDFIDKHFERGCKEHVFDVDFRTKYNASGKHTHTVALYLLGLLFRDVFFQRIAADLENIGISGTEQERKWYTEKEYSYTWYLTCLYHDFASCVETVKEQQIPCCNNCVFKLKTPYTHKNIFAKRRTARFSERVVKNYCRYRMASGKQDHGIYGGVLLFDRLCKNFRRTTRGHNWNNEPNLEKKGLNWRREHLEHYAYIADAIICHNIWMVRPDDEEGVKRYHKFQLDELIVDSPEKRLSIHEYPLHFMLCLLDTIEPVKRFTRLSARTVLENISIESNGNNGIRVAWTEMIKRQGEFWKWMQSISGLSDWMNVDVSSCDKEGDWCYVTIDFR